MPPHQLALLLDLPLVRRTRVPVAWVNGATEWHSILARRWTRELDISEGELRSAAMWQRILARDTACWFHEYLDLSDNFAAVAVLARGRSSKYALNQVCRRSMSHEAVTGVRQRASWVDLRRMPADDGTRPDGSGNLKIGRILFAPRTLV